MRRDSIQRGTRMRIGSWATIATIGISGLFVWGLVRRIQREDFRRFLRLQRA